MKKYFILLLTFLCVTSVYARKGYDRNIKPSLFVPKGSWMGGVTFSYTELTGDNYKLLILDDVNGEGYTFNPGIFKPKCRGIFHMSRSPY